MSKVNIWVRPARPAVAVPNVKIIDMGFDPTSLSLTGFWRASYSGAPWVPTASAGTSGANGNLVAGPPAANVGASVAGYTPADFDGATTFLTNVSDATTLYTVGAGTILCLFKARSSVASLGTVFQDATLIRDTNSDVGISFTNSGLTAYAFSGGYKTVTTACTTGAYHLVMMRWDSTTLGLTIDSGAESTVACGALSVMIGTCVVGQGYVTGGPKYIDGTIFELATMNSKASNGNYSGFKLYCNAKYGISL